MAWCCCFLVFVLQDQEATGCPLLQSLRFHFNISFSHLLLAEALAPSVFSAQNQRVVQDPLLQQTCSWRLGMVAQEGRFWNEFLEHRKCHRESCWRVAYVYPWSCTEDMCNYNPTSGHIYFSRMPHISCVWAFAKSWDPPKTLGTKPNPLRDLYLVL